MQSFLFLSSRRPLVLASLFSSTTNPLDSLMRRFPRGAQYLHLFTHKISKRLRWPKVFCSTDSELQPSLHRQFHTDTQHGNFASKSRDCKPFLLSSASRWRMISLVSVARCWTGLVCCNLPDKRRITYNRKCIEVDAHEEVGAQSSHCYCSL